MLKKFIATLGILLIASILQAYEGDPFRNNVDEDGGGVSLINIGGAGVSITDDGDGAITYLGKGNGFDEDLKWNYDDVSDTVSITSTTGVTLIDFGTIGISANAITITGGGSLDGLAGTDADTFTINNDFDDVTASLILGRTTGGNATIGWNGTEVNFNKYVSIGTNDTAPIGILNVYGGNSTSGGLLKLYSGADNDGVYDFWWIQPGSGNFYIGRAGEVDITIDDSGDVTLGGSLSMDELTLTGTGTINGLDAIDATSETTIEAAMDTFPNAITINNNDGIDDENMLIVGDSDDLDNAIVYGRLGIGADPDTWKLYVKTPVGESPPLFERQYAGGQGLGAGLRLRFVPSSGVTSANDGLGVVYQAANTAGTIFTYASFEGLILNATPGSEEGTLVVWLEHEGIDHSGYFRFAASDVGNTVYTAEILGESGRDLALGANLTKYLRITQAGNISVFGPDFSIGTAGVKFTDDGDGAITLLGLGDGYDESITLNFDDVENVIDLTSSTGVTDFDFNTIDVNTDTLDLTGIGTINGLDVLDATSETTIEDSIDTLANLTSVQGQTIDIDGALTVSSATTVGQTWTTPSFDAANFTGTGSMTWTLAAGDVTTYAYTITGKTMQLSFYLVTTTVGGTLSTGLGIKIPASKTSTKRMQNTVRYWDNLVEGVGTAEVTAGGTVVYIYKNTYSSANWTASTDQTYIMGQITFEIN